MKVATSRTSCYSTYGRTPTAQPRVSCPEKSTPLVVENRGSKSAVSVVSLTEDMATIVVSSFNPRVKSLVSLMYLVAGCVASLLVALLVYGRQVLVLSYKDGMERATMISSFKSWFVADISHEIRTPLNGIIGTAELLAKETMSVNAGELVNTIQACSKILLDM